jgi:hypothetical protein
MPNTCRIFHKPGLLTAYMGLTEHLPIRKDPFVSRVNLLLTLLQRKITSELPFFFFKKGTRMVIIVPVLANFLSPGTLTDGKDYLLSCLSPVNAIPILLKEHWAKKWFLLL